MTFVFPVYLRIEVYNDRAKYSLYLFLIEIFRQGIEFKLIEHDNVKIDRNILEEFLENFRLKI